MVIVWSTKIKNATSSKIKRYLLLYSCPKKASRKPKHESAKALISINVRTLNVLRITHGRQVSSLEMQTSSPQTLPQRLRSRSSLLIRVRLPSFVLLQLQRVENVVYGFFISLKKNKSQ